MFVKWKSISMVYYLYHIPRTTILLLNFWTDQKGLGKLSESSCISIMNNMALPADDLAEYTCVCIIVLTSAFLKQTFPLFTPLRSQIDGKLFPKLSNLLPHHNFDQQNPSIWLVGVLLNTGRDWLPLRNICPGRFATCLFCTSVCNFILPMYLSKFHLLKRNST